jgi:hypothetical protein
LAGNQEYGSVSGTSASAALGAGVISLLQSAEQDLTPDDITHILEKTALPLGSPGYDNQGGYGLMDAGAAMNYVQNHDIKHGTTTDGQVQQIYSGVGVTLYSSAWEEVASGAYLADIHKVTYTIPLVPSQNNDLWFNAKGTYGWSGAVPNDQNRYANVELHNDHATVTTFIYKLYNTAGGEVGWHPTSPDNLQLSYSYVGEIPAPQLEVDITGPTLLESGQQGTWTANLENGSGSYNYQWYYRNSMQDSWHASGSNSATYSRTFFNASSSINMAGVRVVVTGNGENAEAVQSVTVGAQGCTDPWQIEC